MAADIKVAAPNGTVHDDVPDAACGSGGSRSPIDAIGVSDKKPLVRYSRA